MVSRADYERSESYEGGLELWFLRNPWLNKYEIAVNGKIVAAIDMRMVSYSNGYFPFTFKDNPAMVILLAAIKHKLYSPDENVSRLICDEIDRMLEAKADARLALMMEKDAAWKAIEAAEAARAKARRASGSGVGPYVVFLILSIAALALALWPALAGK